MGVRTLSVVCPDNVLVVCGEGGCGAGSARRLYRGGQIWYAKQTYL